MKTEPSSTEPKRLITSAEWDTLRYHFQDSVMAKTSLCKLAKDMGSKWPIRGKDETPEKYIGHTLEALSDMHEFYGNSNRLPLLYTILKETLSLDEPYSEMVRHFDEVSSQEDEAIQALQELEIPVDFPVEFANFSDDTLNLCRAEKIGTIGRFVEFAQQSAKTVVISGDYRLFLNSLVQRDIKGLRAFLPLREGEQGLFLAESIGHLASQLSDRQAASLLNAYQISTTRPAWAPEKALSKADTLALLAEVKEVMGNRFDMMPDQAQQLRHAVQSGEAACVRFFISLRDAEIEGLAMAIAMAALEVKPRFKGLISRILK
jgi:hypothetical protein